MGQHGAYDTISFTAVWYACGIGEVEYSILSHGPLYGSLNALQLVQKRIEVSSALHCLNFDSLVDLTLELTPLFRYWSSEMGTTGTRMTRTR
jgi:hypothetical protein